MKIAFFDTHSYDKNSFTKANEAFGYDIDFRDYKLNENTALTAQGYDVACVFVNDVVNAEVIAILKKCGVKLISLRCAGFNNVNLKAAAQNGIKVVRVPAYSPYAVAEHGVALLMALTRHIPQAYLRTKSRVVASPYSHRNGRGRVCHSWRIGNQLVSERPATVLCGYRPHLYAVG